MNDKNRFGLRSIFCPVTCLVFLLSLNAAIATAQVQGEENGLSKQFMQSAITAMASIHQVKESIATVVAKNLPGAYYNPHLGSQAELDVRTAQLHATTSADQQAATLLDSYFNKVRNWGLKYKSARESMNGTKTIDEKFLENDSEWQSIGACEKGLNAMLTARTYSNVPACH
jgi:hypothetical protein